MIGKNDEKGKLVVSLDHRERARWLRGLAADPGVSSSAVRLAVVICDLMHPRSGECFAEQDTLASLTATSARRVREYITALSRAGWLAILKGKERTRARSKSGVHYRPMWPDEETKNCCLNREYLQIRTGGKPPVLNDVKCGGKSPVSDAHETGDLTSQNRRSGVSKPAENRRSHSRNLEEPIEDRASSPVPNVEFYDEGCSNPSTRPPFADARRSEDTLPGNESPSSLVNRKEVSANIERLDCAAAEAEAEAHENLRDQLFDFLGAVRDTPHESYRRLLSRLKLERPDQIASDSVVVDYFANKINCRDPRLLQEVLIGVLKSILLHRDDDSENNHDGDVPLNPKQSAAVGE